MGGKKRTTSDVGTWRSMQREHGQGEVCHQIHAAGFPLHFAVGRLVDLRNGLRRCVLDPHQPRATDEMAAFDGGMHGAPVPVIGCASVTSPYRVPQGWVAYEQAELVQRWGKPITIMRCKMVSTRSDTSSLPKSSEDRGPTARKCFPVTNCMINFDVSPEGVIEGASTAGERCRIELYGFHRTPISHP